MSEGIGMDTSMNETAVQRLREAISKSARSERSLRIDTAQPAGDVDDEWLWGSFDPWAAFDSAASS